MFGGGRVKYSVPAPPLSKHRRNTAGICRSPMAYPTTTVCRGTRRAYRRYSLAQQEDFYFPCVGLTARLAAASCGYRTRRGRTTIPAIATQRQVGPRCGHDTWGTSFNDGFPLWRDYGDQLRVLPPPAKARTSARWSHAPPSLHLRSLPLGPMHASTPPFPNEVSLNRVRQQPSHSLAPASAWFTRIAGRLSTTG